jgi:sigma-B regulation protein RsbU (phosphoserine phosphatase)
VAGLPLGLISGTAYAQTAVEFGRGDTLLLYTDGVTESRNESGEELGQEGLLALVRGLPVDPMGGLVAFGQDLVARLERFRGRGLRQDDETLVLLQRHTGVQ